MPRIEVAFGRKSAAFDVAAGQLSRPQPVEAPAPLVDPAAVLRQTLEAPTDFPPLHRIFTPDDEVVVALDPSVPCLAELLTVVLDEILRADVQLEHVTLLVPPEAPASFDVRPRLPERLHGLSLCRHERHQREELAYIAGTKSGRAIYLNRSIVDAGQAVVLSRVGYDPVAGYHGSLSLLYPTLADAAAWQEHGLHASAALLGRHATPAAKLAKEAAWLLGLPFLIEVQPGPRDTVAHLFAGTADSLGEAPTRLLDRQRRLHVSRTADLVLASVAEQTLAAVMRAFLIASRVVQPGGSIVVLSEATGELGPGLELLRQAGTPVEALAKGKGQELPDRLLLWELAAAAQHARLFLLSQLPATIVEELQITPLEQPAEVQRLIDQAQTTLLLPEADRGLIELA